MNTLDEVMDELAKPIPGEAFICLFTLPLDESKWKRLTDEFGLVLALPTRNPTLPPEVIYSPKLPEGYCPYAPPLGSGGDFTVTNAQKEK